jgi:hypothetical protein
MFLFDGGVLVDETTRRFRLPADELAAWRFFARADLDTVVPEPMARRLRFALDLAETNSTAYLEHGYQP